MKIKPFRLLPATHIFDIAKFIKCCLLHNYKTRLLKVSKSGKKAVLEYDLTTKYKYGIKIA
jgi:hypothetical protein